LKAAPRCCAAWARPCKDQPALFGPRGRPGHLFEVLVLPGKNAIEAHELLSILLTGLSSIWPAQNLLGNIALGDCWRHAAAGEADAAPARAGCRSTSCRSG
jgi:hypothetical protein